MKYYYRNFKTKKYSFLKYNNKTNYKLVNYYSILKSIFYNYKIYINLKFNFDFLINNYKYILLKSSFNINEYNNFISSFENDYIDILNCSIYLFYYNCYYIITKLYDAINSITCICKIYDFNTNDIFNNINYKNKIQKQYNNFKNIILKINNIKQSTIIKNYINDNF